MTSQSPRIYIYKITFEEVSYYYYGVKKEKYFNQEYWGAPITHKWMWDFYTPKKQILQFFDYTDDGYVEAQEVEKRLIKPVYNTDKWCLNENCGGIISLKINRETGKKVGLKNKENKTGVCGKSKEKIIEDAKNAGAVSGRRNRELNRGIFSLTKEEKIEIGKENKRLKLGVHGRTKEQMTEDGKKGGAKAAKIINSQRWMCNETGYVSTPGGLSSYQKARGIDTSKRKRIA
jgi:hypothetical protein